MKCDVLHSCDRPAEYEIRIDIGNKRTSVLAERYACGVHARALDDEDRLVRAVRLGGAADYMRAMRAAKKDAGGCIECSAPAVTGQRRCEKHRAAHNKEARRDRADDR
jgi:hypothetical protein